MTPIEEMRASLFEGEAALITSGANRFYLTGFPSSAGEILITREKAYFIVDFRYIEAARAAVREAEVILMQALAAQRQELLAAAGVRTLYIETEKASVRALAGYRAAHPTVTVSEDGRLDTLLRDLRSVKRAEEIAHIRAAQEMTDATFSYILERIAAGRTEREIALDMEFYMRRLGSEGVAFDTIVVSGENSSMPHGVPTDKPIARGDFITMDFGARSGGYCADMTRTVAVGEVTDLQRDVYETVLAAQKKALAAIRPGMRGMDVDRIAREHIAAAGYDGFFGHGLGHSLGIEVHEPPACNTRDTTVLRTGTVMTVEPGIYLDGRFGVRIEDMVLLTENGAENLTHSKKDLIIL